MTGRPDLSRWSTWHEIGRQPAIWRNWAQRFDARAIRSWIASLGVDEVWLCGAGSSAYIGEMIAAGLEGAAGPRLRAVASTDLVSRPAAFLRQTRPLVVSFGRSGNSAETNGTLDALDVLAPGAPRLNITCNADSALATRAGSAPQRVIVLPEATHDAGFAMTSSLTTMLLTALSALDPDATPAGWERLAAAFDGVHAGATQLAAGAIPARIVFVGTGPLAFAAREAALKVMELTTGQVPALWDSTLGFRHGPKAFVRDNTAIIAFQSTDPHAARYDADLAAELAGQFPDAAIHTVGPAGAVPLPADLPDVWNAPLAVIVAQVLGAIWSDRLGLDVDDPFRGQGTLTRVVSGVQLYEVEA